MKRDLAEKYLNGTCTEEEAGQALKWFSTPGGQSYLEKKIGEDLSQLQDKRLRALVSEADSDQMWNGITRRTGYDGRRRLQNRKKRPLYWGAVAVACILLTSSMVYLWPRSFTSETEPGPIYHSTGAEQQKVITLNDGSEIRMNSNSELWISGTFGESGREVKLDGEAYFKVTHDREKPFVIHTAGASVKDLGTAFNVKAYAGDDNVQVAVTEGKVSLWSDRQTEKEAAELSPGQFGLLSLRDHTIEVDGSGIHNYLSWLNGRMEFEKMPLEKVCTQLHRIYGVSFEYSSLQMKNLVLSSNFERGSLNKALEVIALTLELDYNRRGDTVRWKAGEAAAERPGSG